MRVLGSLLRGFWSSEKTVDSFFLLYSKGELFTHDFLLWTQRNCFSAIEISLSWSNTLPPSPKYELPHSTEGRGEHFLSDRPDLDWLYDDETVIPNSVLSLIEKWHWYLIQSIKTIDRNKKTSEIALRSQYVPCPLFRSSADLWSKKVTTYLRDDHAIRF